MIPKKTIGLIDRLEATAPITSIGIPVVVSSAEKHRVPNLRGPWRIASPPSAQQADDLHLFRLTVNKDKKRSWRIDVTDLNKGRTIVHQSGFKAALSMNGQVKTGTELLALHGSADA